MVAVQILDQRDHIEIQRENKALDLTSSGQIINQLLDRPGAMHVERDRD